MCEMCLGQGCPNCWPPLQECERCNGMGKIYFILDADTYERHECTEEDYLNTPDEYRDYEDCPECDGRGEK